MLYGKMTTIIAALFYQILKPGIDVYRQ